MPNLSTSQDGASKTGWFVANLLISEWKWEHVNMDFVVGLPRCTRGFDSIWVVVDRLTKFACFLPVKATYNTDGYAKLYVAEIVKFH